MGRRGPPPKPTKLQQLRGNPGKRKLNDREPEPAPGTPTVPSWLPAEAKAEWRRVVPELGRLRLLSVIDRGTLSAYVLAWDALHAATLTLAAEGRVVAVPVLDRKGEVVG